MLLPVAVLALIATCGLVVLAVSTTRFGPVAELVGIGAAMLPVGPVVAAFLWVDRWEPEPARLLWYAFGWGACVATITALLINNTAELVGDQVLGHGHGDVLAAVVSAPLFEEAAKGAFVLGVLVLLREEFDGVVDGVVYAGMCAAGFAFTENIYYFARAFSEQGLGTVDAPGVVAVFILRAVVSPFTHPLFTCLIGVGLGLAARSPSPRMRWLAPVAGYLGAVLLHAAWNAMATFGNGDLFVNLYLLVMVPVFVFGVIFVNWHRRREQRIVAAALPAMADTGLIAEAERELLATLPGRKRWRAAVRRAGGRRAARSVGEYQASVTELAFLRYRISRGTAGPDPRGQQLTLIAALRAARARADEVAGTTEVPDRR